MRSSAALLAVLAAMPFAALRSQANPNPCANSACAVVFDWGEGGAAPDVDRIYGSPATMEAEFAKVLTDAGWQLIRGTANAAITMTVRPVVQQRVRCEKMSGTNTDMSCHTVVRGTVIFATSDSAAQAPHRVEIIPRCSDPKAYPSFLEFGRFAGEMVLYQAAGGKGSRPRIACRT
jgi:hypothetical protein